MVDFDVSSTLEVSRLEIIDADAGSVCLLTEKLILWLTQRSTERLTEWLTE